MSQEDILKMFTGHLSKRDCVLRNHALNLIKGENDKCLITDTKVIIQELESSTRRELVHGTGLQKLYVYISEEDGKSYVNWENTDKWRIVKIKLNEVLLSIIKKGGKCFALYLFCRCIQYIKKKLNIESLSEIKTEISTLRDLLELSKQF